MPCTTAGLERRPVEQRRRQHVHGVEPAAGLRRVLDDEVARVVVLEPVGVLERVVHLGERHRAGLEPAVEHLRHPAHRRAAGRVVGVGPGQLVDVRPVQVVGPRPWAEVALQLVERPVHVGARVGRVVGLPDRDRAAPVAVAADRPVAGVGQPLAEAAVAHVRRRPADLLVELDHAVAERRHLHEPARHRLVDQRVVAAPAVRVGVLVGLVAQHLPGGLEVGGDVPVGLEHVLALRTAAPPR